MDRAFIVHSEELNQGGYPEGCPFNSSRAGKTVALAKSLGILEDRMIVQPERASRSELERFHTPAYLDVLESCREGDYSEKVLEAGLGTPDCPVFPGLYSYVSLAAGATLTGAKMLLEERADLVFNPSGGFHHAAAGSCSGFCYMNDIVLAAQLMSDAGKKVLFLDLDVHHCDGVQDAFYYRSDVMVMSMHESGRTLFPGTGNINEIGSGDGAGCTVNFPLPVGTYDEAYMSVFRKSILPVVCSYDPDVIVLEMGMDALAGDPMAHLHLSNSVFADIMGKLMELEKPMLVTGGGGYNVENTVRGWALLWSVICGADDPYAAIGMGGVMTRGTDWIGGLRDSSYLTDAGRPSEVDLEIKRNMKMLKAVRQLTQ